MAYPYDLDAPPAPTAADIGTLLTAVEAGQLVNREDVRIVLKFLAYGIYTFYGAGPQPFPHPTPSPSIALSFRARCAEAAGFLKLSGGDLKAIPWLQLLPILLELLKIVEPSAA